MSVYLLKSVSILSSRSRLIKLDSLDLHGVCLSWMFVKCELLDPDIDKCKCMYFNSWGKLYIFLWRINWKPLESGMYQYTYSIINCRTHTNDSVALSRVILVCPVFRICFGNYDLLNSQNVTRNDESVFLTVKLLKSVSE